MFTPTQFASKFENKGSLGGQTAIRDRIQVLATKGHIKFVRGEPARKLGLKAGGTKFGYLVAQAPTIATPLLARAPRADQSGHKSSQGCAT